MKPILLFSLSLFTATVLATKFPVRRHSLSRRSGSASIAYTHNSLATASNALPGDAFLSTVNDMIYIANITLGGVDYRVQMDTGSSDLWIQGPTSPLPNSNQTPTTFNVTYGIGWAFGHISHSSVQFSGISVPNQTFLDVSSAQSPAVTYGANGIIGLGFTSRSTIDNLVTKMGSSSGHSLLYNLFSDKPNEPNFIAFSLQRSTDPAADVQGTFLIGELDPDYAAVNKTPPIPTFPVTNPNHWTVLLDAILVGNTAVPMTTTVPNAPSNRAVALLDSGSSYSYAPPEVCHAIYGDIPGAQLDPESKLWLIPCNTEIDAAVQIDGQVFPLHPLDTVPVSAANPGGCVGSFVSQDISAIAAGTFDIIIGDNVLRSMYSVYDFGDFDASGNMGNPYVKFLSLVDPNEASKEFATARGTVPRTNITFSAANSPAAPPVSVSDDVTNTLHKINTYFPIMLAILGLNALVILLLAIAAFIYLWRRRNASSALKRRTARRLTPMPMALEAMSIDSPRGSLPRRSSRYAYEPVSVALTDDTFVPPSPAFHHAGSGGSKARTFDDRPKSVA